MLWQVEPAPEGLAEDVPAAGLYGAGIWQQAPDRSSRLNLHLCDLRHPPERAPLPGATLMVDVRGHGTLSVHQRDDLSPDHPASSTARVLSELLALGDSLFAGRVRDVLQAARVLRDRHGEPAAPITVTAEPDLARVAYAASLADPILIWSGPSDPPGTWQDATPLP
ncbi:hypothetical protein [Parenemella sanctibonifatiensis]|uniref:Uncharacterized protein n=1 Tax=Parenemella sanctibonifatiensis TaxID=2016505 RepID=A0A255E749_9ACTN|nr:hypothetical protein [Parenemella sanctibonifatiensis]OYN85222.1 hypothetical protein CGZ92_10420 [Parenemella sanctibonifatiensis]